MKEIYLFFAFHQQITHLRLFQEVKTYMLEELLFGIAAEWEILKCVTGHF